MQQEAFYVVFRDIQDGSDFGQHVKQSTTVRKYKNPVEVGKPNKVDVDV